MPASALWDAVAAHFFTPASMSRIVAISEAEVQVEGWFKGELIWLFGQLKARAVIQNWRCECLMEETSKKRLDFKLEIDGKDAAIEVKSAIRQQKGISYDVRWYAQQNNGFLSPGHSEAGGPAGCISVPPGFCLSSLSSERMGRCRE